MTKKRAWILPGLVLAFLFWGENTAAQGANWWTNQYGTRAELLGGAVVGSFIDLSSTYYNPGAVVLSRNAEVLLSADAFQYQNISLTNPENPNLAQNTTRFGTAPTLFAGLFPSGWLTGQLAYSALTRQDFDFRLEGRYFGIGDVMTEFPGDENYAFENYLDHDLTENWFGATWSHAPKENLGIGATLYGAYRSQRVRSQKTAQAASDTSSEGATVLAIDSYYYKTLRFLAKIGLAFDYAPFEIGLTLTTPSVSILGDGWTYYNRNIIGLDLDGNGTPDSELSAEQQDDLSATYKAPVSIATGASYRWSGSAIHFSCEWFNGVDAYQLLDIEPSPEHPGPTESLIKRVTEEYAPVFNVGFGFERTWTESFHGYVSFVTDFSASTDNEVREDAPRGLDLYHLSAGAAANIKGLSLTLGIAYAFGKGTFETISGSELTGVEDAQFGPPIEAEVNYRRLKAIIGFAFTL